MARFSTSFVAYLSHINAFLFDIRTSATDYPVLLSLEAIADGTTLGVRSFPLGIGIPASLGVARPSGIAWIADDAVSPLPNITIGTDWSTFPTAPANYFRRTVTNEFTAGATVRWDTRIKIAPASALVCVFLAGLDIRFGPRQMEINLSIDA